MRAFAVERPFGNSDKENSVGGDMCPLFKLPYEPFTLGRVSGLGLTFIKGIDFGLVGSGVVATGIAKIVLFEDVVRAI
ncbi:MAG: hypothetical protein C4292_00655 [Nitrososphaera sp.]